MKIALLTDGIWPFVIGGMQKHSYYLCKYLAIHKIEVQLYFTAPSYKYGMLASVFSEEELQFIEPVFVAFPKAGSLPGHYISESKQYSKRVFEHFCKREKADIIYAKGLTSWFFLKKKERGASLPPICIMVHGYEFYQKSISIKSYIDKLILRPIFRYINEQADYIHSYGDSITKLINAHYKKRKGKIISIPSAIGREYVNTRTIERSPLRRFTFVGRWERRKGVPELMKAVSGIEDNFPFSMTIVCNVPDKEKIVSAKITYLELISNKEDLLNLLENSEFLVCPSYSEGMPNVVFEGMAAGCAIIATNVGAVSTQVGVDNGWLLPAISVETLTSVLAEAIAIDDDSLLCKRRASVNKITDNFLWEEVVIKFVEFFSEISEKNIDKRKRI